MTRPRIIRSLLGGTLLTGLLIAAGAAAPATAASEGGLLLSYDGVSFADVPQGNLFPDDAALAPGGSITGTLHVRNVSGAPAELQLAVRDADSDRPSFLRLVSMTAASPATPVSAPVPLDAARTCAKLLSGEVLRDGSTTVLRVVLAMDARAGNADQRSGADAVLQVALVEPGAPDLATTGCTAGEDLPVDVGDGDGPGENSGTDAGEPGRPGSEAGSGSDSPGSPEGDGSGDDGSGGGSDDGSGGGSSEGDSDENGSGGEPDGTTAPEAPESDASGADTDGILGSPPVGLTVAPVLYPSLGVVALLAGVILYLVVRSRRRQVGK